MQQAWDKAHHTTKVKHLRTNGYRERFNKTLVDKFYAVAFRKERYERSEELEIDLDNVMDYYNYRRMHQGYKLKQNDCRIRAESRFSRTLTLNREIGNLKQPESIRGEKEVEVQEDLPFTQDSVTTENKNKEILECQLVITS